MIDDRNIERRITHWFNWPWNDLCHSASLACALVRFAIPPVTTLPTSQVVTVGAGPYRSSEVVTEGAAELPEVETKRCAIDAALRALQTFASGSLPTIPYDFMPDRDPQTRLYWYARELALEAQRWCWTRAAEEAQRWCRTRAERIADPLHTQLQIAGNAAAQATELLQKVASGSGAAGLPGGAGNAALARIVRDLIYSLNEKPEKIEERVIWWRIHDGLRGRYLPEDISEDLRLAFEAAWMAGEYKYGYGLLDPDKVEALIASGT